MGAKTGPSSCPETWAGPHATWVEMQALVSALPVIAEQPWTSQVPLLSPSFTSQSPARPARPQGWRRGSQGGAVIKIQGGWAEVESGEGPGMGA